MTKQHQSTTWQMLAEQPRHLHVSGALHLQARSAGWLRVQRGQVWLTRDGDGDDHVLGRGEQFWLQAGQGLVIEPWKTGGSSQLAWAQGSEAGDQETAQRPVLRPAARREAGAAGAALLALAAVLRGAAGRLLAAARSAEAIASRPQGSIRAGDSIASCGAAQ